MSDCYTIETPDDSSGAGWDVTPEGEFDTLEAALLGVESLLDIGWTHMRIVNTSGDVVAKWWAATRII